MSTQRHAASVPDTRGHLSCHRYRDRGPHAGAYRAADRTADGATHSAADERNRRRYGHDHLDHRD